MCTHTQNNMKEHMDASDTFKSRGALSHASMWAHIHKLRETNNDTHTEIHVYTLKELGGVL